MAQPPAAKCETFLLCDKVGTSSTPFIRRICKDATGTTQPPEDTDLDGAAYLVQGEVGTCENGTDLEIKVMCDGGTTSFLRWYVAQGGQPTGQFFDTDLDGVAYTPDPAAVSTGQCPQDAECAPTPTTQLLYDIRADGTVVPFLRHMVVDCEGNVLETNDTALDGQDYIVDPNGQVVAQPPLPMAECTPNPDETSVAASCGAGEPVDVAVLETRGANTDARVEQDASGDQVCSGRWTTSPAPQAPGFPINESFRYAGFDTGDANWTLQGEAVLTAGISDNPDPAGEGRLKLSNPWGHSNGAAIYIPVFSNADNIVTEVSWASHGTSQAGDGWMQFFSDGSQPPQDNPLGGGGNLGLFNIDYPFIAVVLDEYGGSGGEGGSHLANSLRIKACFEPGGPTPPENSYRDIHTVLLPNSIGNRPRGDEPRLRTSIVTENGETFISAAIDWNDGNGFVSYISRFNVTAECGGLVAPATLRTGFSGSSGGAFGSIHELSDLNIQQAGVQSWRALQINADPLPACATQAKVRACVNAMITQTDATAANASPELFFWLVNAATQTVISTAEASAVPPDGIPRTLCVDETVNAADLPNLRLYVGADRRDQAGGYSTEWQGLNVEVTALCPVAPQKTIAISAPCPIPVDPGCAPTPTTQLLYDIRASGTVLPFLRHTVVDCEGNVLETNDTALDGQDYIVDPNGQVVPQPPAEEPCAATVHAHEMRDLRADVEPNEEGQRCAVPFFRNYVYDCEGNFVRHYDTDAEGQPYTPIAVADTTDGIPSLVELEWPQTNVIADPDGQEGHDYIYIVTNPRTNEEARIKFNTVTAPGGSTPCGASWEPGQRVSVNAPLGQENPASRFTFTLDEVAQRMTSLRLDFIDIDPWEGVRGLDPVPDRVEFIDGEGVWVPGTGDIDALVQNVTAHAYYDNPPATITHLYRNAGGGFACHAATFQGLTYAAGPYCNCGCPGGGGGSDCVTATTQVLCDVLPATTVTPYTFDFITNNEGITSTPVTQATAPNGVVYSINQGTWFSPSTNATPGLFLMGDESNTHQWTFHNGPVDLEFDVREVEFGNESKYLQFPEGTEAVQVTQPLVHWDPTTYRLYRGPGTGADLRRPNRFRLRNVTSLAFTPSAGGTLNDWSMMSVTVAPVVDRAAPVQFLRHISTDCDGNVLSVTDLTLDGSSEYQPEGQVQLCSDCVTTTQVLCDVLPTPAVRPYTFDFATNDEGITSTPVTEATAPNGVIYSINQGTWFGPATVTPGLFLLGDETNHHVWHFHNGPVDLEFDIREIEFGVDPKYLHFQVGTEMLEVTQPLVFWDATTHRLHREPGSGADIKRANRFRLRNIISLDLSPSPGTTLNGWAMVGLTVTPAVNTPDPVQFLRHTTLDCGGNVLSTADVWLDGAPYHPRGQVQFCD
ncbi:hypothetical protein [Chelativorans xinjiangense]|uniref:hypothetical protein n=1 Tax=Chelativorans xinjiangense TaxID=2681485 RepID=UPI001AEDCC61|nr:hypothetical protein [Chelativorans xinjiangense]